MMDDEHFKRVEVLGSQMAYVDTGEGVVLTAGKYDVTRQLHAPLNDARETLLSTAA
jgi:hypothetical protein